MTSLALWEPKNPVATFIDNYGDERVIHRNKGRRLSVFNENLTPQQRMNRACSFLIGKKIKDRRIFLKLSQREVCIRAGLVNTNPKQYMSALENSPRQECMRFGTLYAVALALECEPLDLMPKLQEVVDLAEIKMTNSIAR